MRISFTLRKPTHERTHPPRRAAATHRPPADPRLHPALLQRRRPLRPRDAAVGLPRRCDGRSWRLRRQRGRVRRLGLRLPREVPARPQALCAEPPLRAGRRQRAHRDLLAVRGEQLDGAGDIAARRALPRPLREARRPLGHRRAQVHHRMGRRTRRHRDPRRSPGGLCGHRRGFARQIRPLLPSPADGHAREAGVAVLRTEMSPMPLLGDRARSTAWERDGYWFFRWCVRRASPLRSVYMDLLATWVSSATTHGGYNGASLEVFPLRMDPLCERKAWEAFVHEPYPRSSACLLRTSRSGADGRVPRHAAEPTARARSTTCIRTASTTRSIPFRICWIPLAEIDADVGGLVLAEGLHRWPILHDAVEAASVPDTGRWRIAGRSLAARQPTAPAICVIMDLNTPHSGLANHSDRFRLSMDIRRVDGRARGAADRRAG